MWAEQGNCLLICGCCRSQCFLCVCVCVCVCVFPSTVFWIRSLSEFDLTVTEYLLDGFSFSKWIHACRVELQLRGPLTQRRLADVFHLVLQITEGGRGKLNRHKTPSRAAFTFCSSWVYLIYVLVSLLSHWTYLSTLGVNWSSALVSIFSIFQLWLSVIFLICSFKNVPLWLWCSIFSHNNLFRNTLQQIPCKHWIIWICKVTTCISIQSQKAPQYCTKNSKLYVYMSSSSG